MSTVTANVFESRWGYHPVSRETFLKLKTLHRRYWETVYAVARYVRWDRKTVNQHGPAPSYCPIFVEEKGCWIKTTHKVDGQVFYGSRWFPKTIKDHGIVQAYHAARHPKAAADVVPLAISEQEIDRLYEQVENWFAEQR